MYRPSLVGGGDSSALYARTIGYPSAPPRTTPCGESSEGRLTGFGNKFPQFRSSRQEHSASSRRYRESNPMITTAASLALGLAFLLAGGINVWLVLEAWARVKSANASSRMLSLHRIGGYVFIGLFSVMAYFMVARLRNGGADT